MMADTLPRTAGKLTANAPLAPLVWFKSGGPAEHLFEPRDTPDLQNFLQNLDPATPVMALGLGSNLIVRDGGVPGVVVRLGKAFAGVALTDPLTLHCGGGTSGILVSSTARDHGIAGLEFLRSIPGTVGGFVRMNGGAYGGEVADRLIDCDVVLRNGTVVTLKAADLHYSYRHSQLPEGAIVVAARFHGRAGEPTAIQAEMDRIATSREASQPLRSKTGGSTFKNPPGHKAWQLIDQVGCRGLTLGGAQVSEKHTNFIINTGTATSTEIEALGEEVRRRVLESSGIDLEWEIQRIGIPPRNGEGGVAGSNGLPGAGHPAKPGALARPWPQGGGGAQAGVRYDENARSTPRAPPPATLVPLPVPGRNEVQP
jgi:UDP-N-acetylmuramate dehydrogenase